MPDPRLRPWWSGAVFYQIYPRSFQDSNGDGIGDLLGITRRLGYLRDLGVEALWITPFYPSPQVDFGYDVSDYCAVDPQFGTLEHFDRLLDEAHARGLRVVIDLVPNHTSDQHPWFLSSRASRTSPKRDWYVWRDPHPETGGPPNNWSSNFGPSAWTLDPATGQYYYHQFYREQPDLNWRNPEVERAIHDVVRFWLRRGVDGFRVDAVNYLFEDEALRDNPVTDQPRRGSSERQQLPLYTRDLPETHAVLRRLRGVLEEHGPDRILITEAFVSSLAELEKYYGQGDGVHLPFNFFLTEVPALDARLFRGRIAEIEAVLRGRPTTSVLSNHDLTRAVDRLGPRARSPDVAKLLATLLLTLRGAPFVYYGEELGMVTTAPTRLEDVRDPVGRRYWPHYKGRDGSRTPMQWSSSRHAGFTRGAPWLPVPKSARTRNVEAQLGKAGSVLEHTRRLIALRKGSPALTAGDYASLGDDAHVLAYQRTEREDRVLVLLNMSPARRATALGPRLEARVALGTHRERGASVRTDRLELAPYEAVVARYG